MSDAFSHELFVRVAHMRVLWLATIETLLLRRLLNMEDITLLADNCRDAAASLARGRNTVACQGRATLRGGHQRTREPVRLLRNTGPW